MRAGVRATVLATATVLAMAACGGGGGGGGDKAADKDAKPAANHGPLSGEAPVRIGNFEFKPKTVTVKAGTKVTWTNDDSSIHDIKDTSPLATPISDPLSKGDTFSITYAQPGSYNYVCGIHPYMTGVVEVVS